MTHHPVRHADTGAPCRSTSAETCRLAFPGIHHEPTHCQDVPADTGATTPLGYVGRRVTG